MSFNNIEQNELRTFKGREGIILQGCGGNPQEWLDGFNDHLKNLDILLEGTKFKDENCYIFKHNDITDILFEFTEDVKLDIGKLAAWRLTSYNVFGGTWLTDYVDNKLGGFYQEEKFKPDCPLIGQDGNIFNLMGIATRTLRQNGMADEAVEMRTRITNSGSYDEALMIIGDYVNITSVDDVDEGMDFE